MKESQSAQILADLQAGGTLTARQAMYRFGCDRLAARINTLRKTHPEIQTRTLKVDKGVRIAEYYIEQEADGELFDVRPGSYWT